MAHVVDYPAVNAILGPLVVSSDPIPVPQLSFAVSSHYHGSCYPSCSLFPLNLAFCFNSGVLMVLLSITKISPACFHYKNNLLSSNWQV